MSLCSPRGHVDAPPDATIDATLRVLLGMSTQPADVRIAVRDGPRTFFSHLHRASTARRIASHVCRLAMNDVRTFPIPADEISQVIREFARGMFGDDTPARIGDSHTANFQRLIYNVAMAVVAAFHDLSLDQRASAWVGKLRNAVAVIADLTAAVMPLLPVSPYAKVWSPWHHIAYVLESTNGTVLFEGSSGVRSLPFLILCDCVIEAALSNRDGSPSGVVDLSTAFGWCACSRAWRYAARCCQDKAFAPVTPNCAAFTSAVFHAFHAPGYTAARSPSTSPVHPSSHASSRSASSSSSRATSQTPSCTPSCASSCQSSPTISPADPASANVAYKDIIPLRLDFASDGG